MLDIFSYLMGGFSEILTFTNLMWIFFGGIFGSIVGMLPGLGPATGIAVLLPLTFGMNPVTALSTLTAIYYGAMFGGSRASILINTPGDGGAIAATFDGYPMTKKRKSRRSSGHVSNSFFYRRDYSYDFDDIFSSVNI